MEGSLVEGMLEERSFVVGSLVDSPADNPVEDRHKLVEVAEEPVKHELV